MSIRAPLTCLALLVLAAEPTARAGDLVRFDFRRSPSTQGFEVVGADDGRFAWSRARELSATLDSNDPGARLTAPLPFVLDGTTSFVLEVDFRVDDVNASPSDFFQLSFGLVSSSTTGLNRTGTSLPGPPFFVDDSDTHDAVELAYFPNVTFFGGPFLQPTVFGANTGSAFSNFAANFGPSSDLGDNVGDQIQELPLGAKLRVRMAHDACRQRLVTRVFDVSGPREVELATGLAPLDLHALNLTGTFTVDAVAINAYQDVADFDPSTTSLEAELGFQAITVERLDAPAATLVPRALHPTLGSARILLEGVVPDARPGDAVSVVLVEAGGSPLAMPLSAVATGGGRVSASIPRALAALGGLVVDAEGCVLPVAGPRRVVPF